jgi:hypothetical protein
MIKYPVKLSAVTEDPDGNTGRTIESSDGDPIAFVFDDGDGFDTGTIIVNALNAMNEFPDVSNDGDALIDWISKYIKE